MQIINFDLDGTLVDLYGVEGWLDGLLNENLDFRQLPPLVDISTLNHIGNRLIKQGFVFNVITWTPKDVSERYIRKVKQQKREWVAENLTFINKITCCRYGQNKKKFAPKGSWLLDDNQEVLDLWGKNAVNVEKTNMFEFLKGFIEI